MEGRGPDKDPGDERVSDVRLVLCLGLHAYTSPRITSLRLIQPRIDINQAAQAALSFEQKSFQKATERVRPPPVT
jgi:hypothetical protein